MPAKSSLSAVSRALLLLPSLFHPGEHLTLRLEPLVRGSDVLDGEFVLGARLGTANWEVATRVVSAAAQARPNVLRCSEADAELSTGTVVRVVDGRIWTAPDEKGLITLNVGPTSEIYVVPKRA